MKVYRTNLHFEFNKSITNKIKFNYNYKNKFKYFNNYQIQAQTLNNSKHLIKRKLQILSAIITASAFSIFSDSSNRLLINSYLSSISAFILKKNTLQCFKSDDKEIRRVKEIVNQRLTDLEFKYQGTIRRQNVSFGIRNGKYYIEFPISKAEVNPEAIINAVLNYSQNNNQSKPSKNQMKIISNSKHNEEGIYTMRLDYEVASNTVEYAKNNGQIYLQGCFGEAYDNFKFSIEKSNDFTDCDIDMLLDAYEAAFKPNFKVKTPKSSNTQQSKSFINFINPALQTQNTSTDPIEVLLKNGVMIFQPDSKSDLDFTDLAGYEEEKRIIEDSIMLGLTHGDIYDQITSQTRVKFISNRPRAILFEGPPGCGKTTSAKIIANQVNIPLIYMPLESIMSKWYGESENKFKEIFDATKALGKSIIFIDEIDALAASRDNGIHEATRRILSTLLRKIDGFESDGDVLFICATNRRKDLDAALLSRLDVTITFKLPDKRMRGLIFQKYAKQLTKNELENLAELTENFSGRDIADVCKDAERKWAAMYIRKEKKNLVPESDIYITSVNQRKNYMLEKKI